MLTPDWTIEQIEFWTWVGRIALVVLLLICVPVFLGLLVQAGKESMTPPLSLPHRHNERH